MANRRPVYPAASGTLTMIASPDLIDPAIIGGALSVASLAASGAVSAASATLTTPLPITSGGTGSTTQNFVDLTTAQNIAGAKTFSAALTASAGISATTGTFSGTLTAATGIFTSGVLLEGSLTIYASSSPTQSVIYLNQASTRYLYNDGTNYNFGGTGGLVVGGAISAPSLALTTPLPITSGGTGSATQNFVDLTSAQTIAGAKTFSAALTASAGISATTGAFSGAVSATTGTFSGAVVVSATGTGASAALQVAGDILASRGTTSGAAGVVYLGQNSVTRYLYYNGTTYILNGASLSVNGTTYTSSRATKHSIAPIAFDSVAKIKQLSIVSFKYLKDLDLGGANPDGKGDNNQETHHGIIAEDSPCEFLSEDGKGLAAHTTLAIALDAIKHLTLRIEELEKAAA